MATSSALAADHQAVAVLEAPHAAAGAGVDEADALLGQLGAACALESREVRVAAVDDHVALGQQAGELVDDVARSASPDGHHHPHRPAGGVAERARRASARSATSRRPSGSRS